MRITFGLFRDLHKGRSNWSMKVMVARKYEITAENDKGLPPSFEFILVDLEGDRIQATMPKAFIQKFASQLQEYGAYVLSNVSVVDNCSKFKVTSNQYKLYFMNTTNIINIGDPSLMFSKIFKLKPFPEISAIENVASSELIDVLGRVVGKGPLKYQSEGKLVEIELEDIRDACYALGLLDDDKEYIHGIIEASHWGSAHQVRYMFVTLLMQGSLSRPEHAWESCVDYLSEDILYMRRHILEHPGLQLSVEQIKNLTLLEIEKMLHNRGKSLKDFSTMPYPDDYDLSMFHNHLILDEMNYDRDLLADECKKLLGSCTGEQKHAYNTIMESVEADNGGVFFLYGSGGTGKTFLRRILSAALRSKGEIVLNVASSGIASLLLPNGRTDHSRFTIPLTLAEDSTCNIKPGSPLVELMVKTNLIIWDEAPMVHRHCFEALDRTLRDIMRFKNPDSLNQPFGGKTIVMGGDFWQILPVIPKGTRQDIVNATINSSHLWSHCKVLRLTKNMRLKAIENDPSGLELKKFSEWILSIGDGTYGGDNDGVAIIKVPDDLLVHSSGDLVKAIVDSTYPEFTGHFEDVTYLQGRAILAPTLDDVERINEYMVSQNQSDGKTYLSADSICKSKNNSNFFTEMHSTEFLNTIKSSGLPNHQVSLKVGVSVMLLGNIDHSAGLCNGTRLIITRLSQHVVEAKILNDNNVGEKFLSQECH